jgi:alkylation response protein AidB-like acyl-CoA dehydrogenase
MPQALRFDPVRLPPEAEALREEVRGFLREEIARGTFSPDTATRESSFSPEFSRKVGARGWLGMTWPKEEGGHGRSQVERYVVVEEMLAHRAPVSFHWVADRQSGPVILRYGTEEVKRRIIPAIVRGEASFCIGLSEPNSGSDVFAASTKAAKVEGGWLVNGRKVWTSNAHRAQWMIGLFRTSPATKENRRHGLSQFLVEMSTPGITVRPIRNLARGHDFNEVVFDDVFLPDSHLLGEKDMAWRQATAELAYERSGPDRILETMPVLTELLRAAGPEPSERAAEGIGREVAHLKTLRRMSLSVAGMLQEGKTPNVEAAVVKDLGTNWEQALPGRARLLMPARGGPPTPERERYEAVLHHNALIAPKLTIQGGTREVLRGIIARGLGLR